MFGREVHFQTVTHIEYLVHFAPIRVALLLDGLEQGRYGEEVVFDDAAVVAHEVQHLGLCAAGAVHHSMNLRTKGIEQLLHYRSVCAGGGENQLSGIQRTALYAICQFQSAAVDQLFGYGLVIAFGVFLGEVLGKYVVACRSQSVAAHAAVVLFLVSGLSV